jgi:hypothetical protein
MASSLVQEEEMSMSDHIQTVCAKQGELSSFDLWIIVGEWTPGTLMPRHDQRFLHGIA